MRVNNKKIYDDATFALAVRLVEEGRLTLTEIVKELHTSTQVFIRNMDWHFCIRKGSREKGETDWRKVHKTKMQIYKQKRDTRIVFECQSCSYEEEFTSGQFSQLRRCPKCGSYCIEKKELRNKVSLAELRSENMTGQRFMHLKSKLKSK